MITIVSFMTIIMMIIIYDDHCYDHYDYYYDDYDHYDDHYCDHYDHYYDDDYL